MSYGRIRQYPGGLNVLYGGTRKMPKEFSRPWQQSIPVQTDPERCAFCKRDQVIVLGKFENGWIHLQNKFTPYSFHEMVIPPSCWPEEELRILGGVAGIWRALVNLERIVSEAVPMHNELWVTAHVGALAGQNITHLHYHVHEPERFPRDADPALVAEAMCQINDREEALLAHLRQSPLAIGCSLHPVYCVVVESIFRVGQCFIIPDSVARLHPVVFGALLAEVTRCYAETFRSTQGLAPDFQIFMKFYRGDFIYASYLPILNNHGATDSVGAIISGGSLTHPWTPEETLAALQKTRGLG
ncbi:MAG: hypothetical protein A3C11_02575 [Candidatus Sungbacteria bacterium RIFCSPHIGHO2_02_FULL_49_12]|uniref:HIT domain-containing protein n=1 Tax=Candidatus Sungbacteria bacterium RIFCSPHIGHO2_02_FULL_49_12 TaxID=1802271 RepID=A0A1G2KMR8_9BACT|nr:MAG: hypothetical protein A3C11_02575 [Candidatus Sungbacteria bacterium RIFCSPHIGHO2_02_FULL_49_12]